MSEVAAASLPFEAPGGLLPWLASLWRDLRQAARAATANKEQRELVALIDYAASHLGEPLLKADSIDDLDDRIDEQLTHPTIFHWNALLFRLALPELRREPASPAAFAAAAKAVLGATPTEVLSNANDAMLAWLRAQHALVAAIPESHLPALISEFERASPELLMSPDIPAEVATGLVHGLRAGVVSLALARAVDLGSAIEPWLAHALVERLVSGVRGHLRLLASIPAAAVPDAIVPASERLDLGALTEQHARSRVHAEHKLELARQRRHAADDA